MATATTTEHDRTARHRMLVAQAITKLEHGLTLAALTPDEYDAAARETYERLVVHLARTDA